MEGRKQSEISQVSDISRESPGTWKTFPNDSCKWMLMALLRQIGVEVRKMFVDVRQMGVEKGQICLPIHWGRTYSIGCGHTG